MIAEVEPTYTRRICGEGPTNTIALAQYRYYEAQKTQNSCRAIEHGPITPPFPPIRKPILEYRRRASEAEAKAILEQFAQLKVHPY